MSHFTVLVPAHDEDHLFERLIPYYEYGCSEQFDQELEDRGLLEWQDKTDEAQDTWYNDRIEVVKEVIDGETKYFYTWDDQYRKGDSFGIGSDTHEPPEDKLVKMSFYHLYPTFEKFITDYYGHSPIPGKPGRYGYIHNPNAKWDWYAIGGRWRGTLKIRQTNPDENGLMAKEGIAKMGEKSWTRKDMPDDPEYADSLPKGMVDWEAMKADYIEEKTERWANYQKLLKLQREAKLDENGKITNEVVVDFSIEKGLILISNEEVELLNLPLDEYLNHWQDPDALTYAIIDIEGRWIGRGDMGWWGVDSNRDEDYRKKYWEIVNSIPDDYRLYVVDCHI